jgi:pimeloyl-ACP methyl ester carboxylesterase
MSRTKLRLKKRTNGRFVIARAGLRLLSTIVPPLGERVAMDLFYKPQRRRDPPRVFEPEGHCWRVRTRAGWLAAWDYGFGPTVLLVHGWSGAAGQWSSFIGPLVRAGYNAVALDLPAHGLSEGSRTNLQQWVHAILDTADRVKPIHAVVGHSLGAVAATLALGKGLRAERAVLIASPARDVAGYVHDFASRIGLPAARERGLVARMQAKFGDLDQFDVRKVAARLGTPALFFHDVADAEVPFHEGETLAGTWPGARLQRLEGRGHNRALRDPEVVRQVLSFLASAEMPASRGHLALVEDAAAPLAASTGP